MIQTVTQESSDSQRDQILLFMRHLVSAKNKQQIIGGLNLLATSCELSKITFYTQRSRDDRYKLDLAAGSHANTTAMAATIDSDNALWQFFDALTAKKISPVPPGYELEEDTYAISSRKDANIRSVLLFTSANNNPLVLGLSVLRDIHQALLNTILRIRQNQKIAVRHQAYQYMISHTQESFAQWHETNNWVYFNSPLIYRLGYEPKEWPMDNVFGNRKLVPQSDWKRITQQLKDCTEKKTKQTCIYTVYSTSNKLYWISTTLIPGIENDHKIVNAVSVDITEAKAIEQRTFEQTDLEKWLGEQIYDLFQHHNKTVVDGVIAGLGQRFAANRCYLCVCGEENLELGNLWQSPNALPITVSDNINVADLVAEEFFSDPITIVDFKNELEKIPQLSRNLHNFSDTGALMLIPIVNEQHPLGVLGIEFSEAHRWGPLELRASKTLANTFSMVLIQESLRTKIDAIRQQFQMAMDAASYGFWELYCPDVTINISPTYYEMMGFDRPEKTEYRPIRADNVHIDEKQIVCDYGKHLAEGKVFEVDYESRHYTRARELKWILTRGRVIKWDDRGKPLRAMGTISDITALKKIQTDLQLAYQQAESARVAKGEFLARMSHEIRTPMNAIIGLSYMLLRSTLDANQMGFIQDIDRAAKSLLQIIDDILDFSKIEAGKLLIENHNFNFRRQIERICQGFEAFAQEKNLYLRLEIDPSVPHILKSDSTRIRQVLVILLNNAFKFTNRGEVLVSIGCNKQRDKKLLEFQIKDSGIGLKPQQIATLFDPFTQADGSRTRQYGGTGLGLSIAKLLVEKMGGTIRAESEENVGSAFTFTVLYFSSSRKSKQALNNLSNIDNLSLKFDQLKVLLVEDNKVNQKVAVGMLNQLGINTTLANNGTEAVYIMKACKRNEFDLILMDIEMPFMGGFEATNAIRNINRHRHIPVIAMTAHVVDNDKDRYHDAGMTDCISKPIAPAMLAQAVQNNLTPPSA